MSRREKKCDKILFNNCKGLVWSQIKSVLEFKEFEIRTGKTSGSERSITHQRMKSYREDRRILCFPKDCFNVHVHEGDKTELGEDDCKKIQWAMNYLELTHC